MRRQSNASAYTECSALTGVGVKDVFDEAVLAALLPRHGHDHHHIALVSKCSIIKVFFGTFPSLSRHQDVEKHLLRQRVRFPTKYLSRKSIFFFIIKAVCRFKAQCEAFGDQAEVWVEV